MSDTLRAKTIRLASGLPELRSDLLRVLAATDEQLIEDVVQKVRAGFKRDFKHWRVESGPGSVEWKIPVADARSDGVDMAGTVPKVVKQTFRQVPNVFPQPALVFDHPRYPIRFVAYSAKPTSRFMSSWLDYPA